ncbi:MAG: hypothetical protein NTY35_02615 [Planctomycetota bacterium]|nr:hypothetical protein [Planctomycetota bacterium]
MTTTGTPIRWPLRAWLFVEVCFGVAAVLAIGVSPENSATNFAWPIRPAVMASVLGAFYITTAPLFLLPLFARRWERIRVMILPAALFCVIQLVATFLHWEKFTVGSTPFVVWFASYVLPPPILVAAYVWHQRMAKGRPDPSEEPFPGWLRTLCLACGGVLTAIGAACFAWPAMLIPRFPWTLTPLTTRSLCAWLVLFGTLLLCMARENDRTRCRLASLMTIFALPALVMQMLRFPSEVNVSSPALWIGLGLFAVVFFCGLCMARGSWRADLR